MPRRSQVAPWFRVLEAARALSPDDAHRFTAPQLALQAGLRDTADSQASQIASAWITKFIQWGYAVRCGKTQGEGLRPLNLYSLTEKGRTCVPREGRASKILRLLTAIRAFQKARGTSAEPAAVAALFRTADEVDSEIEPTTTPTPRSR